MATPRRLARFAAMIFHRAFAIYDDSITLHFFEEAAIASMLPAAAATR
jgi:hypothetical protein